MSTSSVASIDHDGRRRADAHDAHLDGELTPLQSARSEYLRGIVRAHFSSIWRFLRRIGFEAHVVDDATQDLFFVALRRIDQARPGHERAFLMGAAYRIAARLKQRAAREISTEGIETDDTFEDEGAAPDVRLEEVRARALLYNLLSSLEESLRIVFVMYELEGLTMQEIADIVDVPLGTVASRLRRARADFDSLLHRHRTRPTRASQP